MFIPYGKTIEEISNFLISKEKWNPAKHYMFDNFCGNCGDSREKINNSDIHKRNCKCVKEYREGLHRKAKLLQRYFYNIDKSDIKRRSERDFLNLHLSECGHYKVFLKGENKKFNKNDDEFIDLGTYLKGSYKGIRFRHNLKYKRDYTNFLLKWLHRRYEKKMYIPSNLVLKIVSYHNRKYGSDSAKNSASPPCNINFRFGTFAEGDFCPIDLQYACSAGTRTCYYCGDQAGAVVIHASEDELIALQDIWTISRKDDYFGGIRLYSDVYGDRLEYLDAEYDYKLKSVCSKNKCNEVLNWQHNGNLLSIKAKRLNVKENKPTLKTINNTPIDMQGSLIISRYLDLNARLIQKNNET